MSRVPVPTHPRFIESFHPDPASCQMARRIQSSYAEVITRMDVQPEFPTQRAGLCVYYNSNNWAFLHATYQQGIGKCLKLQWAEHGRLHDMPLVLQMPGNGTVHLGVRFAYGYLQFYVSMDGFTWRTFGDALRDTVLTATSGTFTMLCAQDLSGAAFPARFVLRSEQEYRAPETQRGAQSFMLHAFPYVRSRAQAVSLNRQFLL